MGRILDIMDAPPEIHDEPGASAPKSAGGALELRNLTFQYPNSRNPVLHNISVSVPAGTTLAIVGHTGSGKSTFINLIPRLFDPPPGTLFLDGKDVRQWPLSELRKNIGYVPQETFLFSDTIHQNIAFGCDDSVDDTRVDWAARVSQMAEDIETFSHKMQTYVGERGITLSGGQKQRVAISRAVATLPKILIFDDSLSNVDTYTEERILARIDQGHERPDNDFGFAPDFDCQECPTDRRPQGRIDRGAWDACVPDGIAGSVRGSLPETAFGRGTRNNLKLCRQTPTKNRYWERLTTLG